MADEFLRRNEAQEELIRLRTRATELETQLRAVGKEQNQNPEISKEAARVAIGEVWPTHEKIERPEQVSTQTTPASLLQHHADEPKSVASKEVAVARNPEAITLNLSPEKHDEKMGELIGLLQEKGVTAAITYAEASGNLHIMDDFHRILMEYVHEGLPVKSIPRKNTSLSKVLDLVLLQVSLPAPILQKDASRDRAKDIHDFINLMEQFYRGTLSIGSNATFTLEIANAVGSPATSAYLAVPISRKDMFEKQITAIFPTARINAVPNDYNIFAENTITFGAEACLADRSIFALREEIAGDPMDNVLSALSKLDVHTEGAALQVVIRPTDGKLSERFRKALQKIRSGESIAEAIKMRGAFREVFHELWKNFTSNKKTPEQRQREEAASKADQEDPRIKAIERKIANPLLQTEIRIVASATTQDRAQAVLSGIESAFEQMSDTAGGNRITFKTIKQRRIKSFAHDFSYRIFNTSTAIPLTSLELALIAHIPRSESIETAPELIQEKNASAPAPFDLPSEGTLLGINRFRGIETKAHITPEDRLRHLYLIGQTGTGKSALLKNIVIQDIQSGAGCCFIDPHGTDVMDILSAIPPERAQDVIYFDPADTLHPLALNMLEYDPAYPEQKTLIVDELLGIFNKLFDMKVAGGPAFEQYFRNAALLVMDNPESGNTLPDIARIFSDSAFREMKLTNCRNAQIVQFWREIAGKATGDQGLQNFAPYITNKFDVFTTNEIMHPIISQQHSSFNIRQIMDERKILLVNLSKGRVGEINSNLLGLVIVGKFLLAALSRADSFGKDLPPFYLTIDEFQNVTTPSIATILSEARKYKLSLTVAHQFIAQLSEDIRNAVFGNVGSVVAFRVGVADTEVLEKQFAPVFSSTDLMRVDNYRAFVRLLVRGQPAKPFNIETLPFQNGTRENMEYMRNLSTLTYSKPIE